MTLVKSAPLTNWAGLFAKRWNSGAYSVFLLHGNVFDIFQANGKWVGMEDYLNQRLLPSRNYAISYDVADGLSFRTTAMRTNFFSWLKAYDGVEGTNFYQNGLPREFSRLAPILRRFFLKVADDHNGGITFVINFPEKIIPASDDVGSSPEERAALVSLLKWATAPELRRSDIGIIIIAEAATELHSDILQNHHVAQIPVELPEYTERLRFISDEYGDKTDEWSDLTAEELAQATSGLTLVRVQNLVFECVKTGERCTMEYVSSTKKRLIEEFCDGLIRFKSPKIGLSLDAVATHTAAKKRLRELAWLIKNGKTAVLERGVLLPGRVGVGKSFIVDCFASECGLPVMELGEFRSKWVGDTERRQARILMTIRSLGPVIVVVDEADAVFGTREADGDSGVSGRVFAAFAAHIGDSSLRGRELWIAMTSRPDLLSIDMKRQGRFGLCVPLFPAQGVDDVVDLFNVVAKTKKITLTPEIIDYIRVQLGTRPLTGSDVDAMVIRAKERAVLAKREEVTTEDLREAVESFIDPLDPDLLDLQEYAAVLACSDKRYLPARYVAEDRGLLQAAYELVRTKLRR